MISASYWQSRRNTRTIPHQVNPDGVTDASCRVDAQEFRSAQNDVFRVDGRKAGLCYRTRLLCVFASEFSVVIRWVIVDVSRRSTYVG